MAIRIMRVKPRPTSPDEIQAHLEMTEFSWQNEQTGQTGQTSRIELYDWIVNKKGKAYIKNIISGDNIYIFGAVDKKTNQLYIRTAENGQWTNGLIDLENQFATPPTT